MAGDQSCILVVEDDELTRESIVELLRESGYAVAEATNGAEALTQLRAHPPPCVILLDLMMPVMSGQEFRREQLKDPTLATIPVIVLSAADIGQLQSLNVDACVAKPFRIERLLSSVSQYCRGGTAW
jgi:CheY-like chemotaxis protein